MTWLSNLGSKLFKVACVKLLRCPTPNCPWTLGACDCRGACFRTAGKEDQLVSVSSPQRASRPAQWSAGCARCAVSLMNSDSAQCVTSVSPAAVLPSQAHDSVTEVKEEKWPSATQCCGDCHLRTPSEDWVLSLLQVCSQRMPSRPSGSERDPVTAARWVRANSLAFPTPAVGFRCPSFQVPLKTVPAPFWDHLNLQERV